MIGEFIRSVKSEKVSLATRGTALSVTGEAHRASIQGLSGEDFPVIPKLREPFVFEITVPALAAALQSVLIAASRSGIRPELSGVSVMWAPKEDSPLTFAATDSFRLAEFRVPERELTRLEKETAVSCIIPLRAAQEMMRIAAESEGTAAIAINENQIGFRFGDTDFVSRLLEGTFPNYRSIIPATFGTEVEVSRREFIDLIRQAGLFASKISDVKISVHGKDHRISIESKDPGKGEYEGEIECRVTGDDVGITFNYQFLLEGLNEIPEGTLEIGMNEPNTPVLVRGADSPRYRYVVMPLKP